MIVRDVLNTRPPELLAEWLDALGAFDALTPHDAAARWGVPVREAMERLHAMTGGPLEIPEGKVETYKRVPWTAEASERRPATTAYERQRLARLAQIPAGGATRRELQEIWGLREAGADKQLWLMRRRGEVVSEFRGKHKYWRRS